MTTALTGFDRLADRLCRRAAVLALAALAARHAGPAGWRRADLLWPGFAAVPPTASAPGARQQG